MKNVNPSPRGQARVERRSPWLFILLFLTIAGLSLLVAPAATWARFGTTPPAPAAPLTVLVGPISDIASDGSSLLVAGILITKDAEYQEDLRVGPLVEDAWARVEGLGDGNGGLVATRLKVLSPLPVVKLTGPLDSLEDSALIIDGIPLNRTVTTLVIGDPTPGEDRVAARAAIESTGELLALQVVKVNLIPDDDDDDDDDDTQTGETKLTGVIIQMPEAGGLEGTWIISGIAVEVRAATDVKAQVGLLAPGGWVKVKGHVEGGALIAERFQTTHTRNFHKLSGVLTGLTDLDVSVDDLTVDLSADATIRGNPEVGDRVKVKGRLGDQDNFVAILVQGRGHDGNPPPNEPGLVIRFTGEVQQLPAEGLYGIWRIADREITVPVGAFIDEHKGAVEQGAFVEVTALLGDDNSITAVVIVVTRGNQGNNGGGDDDHEGDWVEFEGPVRSLPGHQRDGNHDGDDDDDDDDDDHRLVGDWDVDGTTVHVSRRTEIKRHDQNIAVGDVVRVSGWRQDDDSVRAARIELIEDNNHPIRFVGEITDLPEDPTMGTWMVDQREVIVGEATELDDEDGEFVIGQRVKVSGNERSDGVVEAREIEALRPPEVDYVGRIGDFPTDLIGAWEVGEKTVITTEETDFEQHNGAFAEGLLVKVKGRLQPDGAIQASRIETLPMPRIEHVGEIVELPASADLSGLWRIGLLYYLVSGDTDLRPGDGDFAEGMLVRAKGRMRPDGVVIADKIESFRD